MTSLNEKAERILLDIHKILLLEVIRQNIPHLEVWAFGSRARWTSRETSDLDLVLRNPAHLEGPVDIKVIGDLKDILMESNLPFVVDVVDWATLSDKFRKIIEREYVVIWMPDEAGFNPGKSEWKKTTLGEIAEIIIGQSPPGDNSNETGNGLPLLHGSTVFGSYHPAPVLFTTEPKKTAETGDILFCMRGSAAGKMNWADQRYAIGRGIAAIRHRNGKTFHPFVKGLIEYHLPILLAKASGYTFFDISGRQLVNLEIVIPESLETQARIAVILSDLEEKIELNRQTNITLERIVRTIFDERYSKFNSPGIVSEIRKSEPDEVNKKFNSVVEPFLSKVEANIKQSATIAQIREHFLSGIFAGEIKV